MVFQKTLPIRHMKILLIASFLLLTISLTISSHAAAPGVLNTTKPDGKPHVFSFGGKNGESFLIDGKPIQIRSAEIHPQRVPKRYWRQRIQMAKAMGLNTIAFYTMWNDFEQPDGSFDFKTDKRDIGRFMEICREEGMWILFRPGPYICGEWDFGGIPPYLLKYPDLKIRTLKDERFMKAQTRYLKAIAPIAKPYLSKNGGPILMTQLENEYGSYGRNGRAYMEWLRDFWTKEGFGPFYTSDGASQGCLKNVTLPGVAVGLDPGKNENHWKVARKMNPGVPVFSSETYPGWFRHWGEGNWKPSNIDGVVRWYMKEGKSFNLFLFHGGTNFGFTAGANNGGKGDYRADLTSYDYGAPVDEQGHATKAYHRMRKIIAQYTTKNGPLPKMPTEPAAMEIADFTPTRVSGLWDIFPDAKPVKADKMWFETWHQNQGLAIYSTTIPAGPATEFTYQHLNDYGQVYLDGKHIKTIVRRLGGKKVVAIPARTKPAKLEVLVEGMGHINFHISMEKDRKGLHGTLKLGGKALTDWKVAPLPLRSLPKVLGKIKQANSPSYRGGFLQATFKIEGKPSDTFFDMSKQGKGILWVNGHNLGRYWNVGPQLRLYCPAEWLKTGENVITIVELESSKISPIRGCKTRNYDQKNKDTRNMDNVW